MTTRNNISITINTEHLLLDMSDCYTWSFPEFIPFCNHLYDFSSFKDFNTTARA